MGSSFETKMLMGLNWLVMFSTLQWTCQLPVNAVTLITRIALEEERTECGNMSFEQNLQEKLLALTDRVRDETMVGLGVRFEDKGGKSTWKWDIGFGSSASQGVGSAASLEVVVWMVNPVSPLAQLVFIGTAAL